MSNRYLRGQRFGVHVPAESFYRRARTLKNAKIKFSSSNGFFSIVGSRMKGMLGRNVRRIRKNLENGSLWMSCVDHMAQNFFEMLRKSEEVLTPLFSLRK